MLMSRSKCCTILLWTVVTRNNRHGADETSGIVEYEVLVPPDASVTVHSGSGSVRAERLHGDVTLEGTNGTMEIVDCADDHVHVRTLNGAVVLTNIRNGHIEISSM